jgi:hypothetical protein
MTTEAAVRVLRQVEVDQPAAFADAMPAELFERLRLTPVPVLFMRKQPSPPGRFRWTGFCHGIDYTEAGEVVLDARLAETATWEPSSRSIQSIYLHEVAHRLTPDHGHDAAFAAMVLVLYLRADTAGGLPDGLWQRSNLYDIRDEVLGDAKRLPRAFSWAWHTALELADTDQTAERCAEIIMQRYVEWRQWLDAEPARQQVLREQQQAKEDADRAEHDSLQAKVRQLRLDRWLWAAAGMAVGAAAATLLVIVH